jgi:hypothetical protein
LSIRKRFLALAAAGAAALLLGGLSVAQHAAPASAGMPITGGIACGNGSNDATLLQWATFAGNGNLSNAQNPPPTRRTRWWPRR